MRRIAAILMILPLSACASREVSPEFQAYLKTKEEIAGKYYSAVAVTPRSEVSVPAPGGGFYTFKTYDNPELIKVEQQAPSEWAGVVKQGVVGATIIGGLAAGTGLFEAIFGGAAATYNTGGGDISISNAGNTHVAAGSGTNSTIGQVHPTEVLVMEPEE